MNSSMTTRFGIGAMGGLLALLSLGCTQTPHCPALGECGGDFAGTWSLKPGFPSCIEDLYNQQPDPRLVGGEVPSARSPVIEPALWDWCNLLVTDNGANIRRKAPLFFYESGPIGRVTLSYTPDPVKPRQGHYTIGISRTGTYTMEFPPVCMRQFGAMDDKPALDDLNMPMGGPTNVCKQLEPQLRKDGIGEGSYQNVTCEINPSEPAGCICAFDVSETGGGSGPYLALGNNTIMHLPGNNFPQEATYCASNGSLELTGARGAYLFGQKGLRTMKMAQSVADPCANGAMDGDETGVDCGGSCPTACP